MESKSEWVKGAVIVGGGPSGLATAACLQQRGVPCVVLERAECVASLWQQRTYDRLRLHLPKHFCELPLMPIPDHFPTYPSKDQFVAYLKAYATRFGIQPLFRRRVESARYDRKCGMWRVTTVATGEEKEEEEVIEYLCRWLVVATGENAEPFVPEFPGSNEFRGSVIHSSSFKSGAEFSAKRVLVVGCANSGMEISLDLCNHNAFPSMVVRSSVHVLPREIMGMFSTFGVAIWLMKWIPVWVVDMLLIMLAWLMLGSTKRYGITRPSMGPLQLKSLAGRTPVLDVGAMALIRKGRIKVMPALECLTRTGARFVNGQEQDFDAVILATGYRSNVPSWLKDCTFFSEEGIPNTPFPNGWKGENGLYAVGFTGKGILGASVDAVHIADDIQGLWNKLNRHISFCNKLTRHLSFRLIRTSSSSSLSSSTPSTPQSLSLSPRFRSSAPRSAPSSSRFSRSGFIHEEAMKHIS